MKYRFRVSRSQDTVPSHRRVVPTAPAHRRIYRLRGRNTLRSPVRESIRWSELFEVGMLPEPRKTPKKRRVRSKLTPRLYTLAKAIACAFPKAVVRICRTLSAWARSLRLPPRKPRPEKQIHATSVLSGVLCAAILVTTLSACGVLGAFFLPYHRPHTSVTIPNFVGKAAPREEPSSIHLAIEYEYNPKVPSGTVIAQSPTAGVTRRVYGSQGYCTVLLRVSKERDAYILEDLRGKTKRDARLILTNQNIQSSIIEEYSDQYEAGTVLSTLPSAGQALKEGAVVTLRVSAGKQKQTALVPSLTGLTESAAHTLLHSGGWQTGTVTYRASSLPIGTVIDQSPKAHAEAEKGAAISYTVSTGDRYDTKNVPDLYGLTEQEAAARLREYGLVVGSRFPVASAAPKGTVITQSPLPGTPITSSTVSVDLFLSS